MSRYQTIRAFRTVTGMTPHAWQLGGHSEDIRSHSRVLFISSVMPR
jgi:AraC-like DNA-binding protein